MVGSLPEPKMSRVTRRGQRTHNSPVLLPFPWARSLAAWRLGPRSSRRDPGYWPRGASSPEPGSAAMIRLGRTLSSSDESVREFDGGGAIVGAGLHFPKGMAALPEGASPGRKPGFTSCHARPVGEEY